MSANNLCDQYQIFLMKIQTVTNELSSEERILSFPDFRQAYFPELKIIPFLPFVLERPQKWYKTLTRFGKYHT